IASSNHANRDAVRAENEMHSLSFWKLLQAAVYLFDDGVQVGWMSVELFYDFGRNIFHLRESDPPVPFIETAARGRFRVLAIEWKQDQFIRSLCLHGLDGFLRHGVAVAQCYENIRVYGLFPYDLRRVSIVW